MRNEDKGEVKIKAKEKERDEERLGKREDEDRKGADT